MAELDFSALNRLAYKGFETEAEREQKDRMIEQGFTILPEDTETPFTAPHASADIKPSTAPEPRSERKREAFTDVSGTRNYKDMYRAAHDFHKRNSPPQVDREYWRTHTSGTPQTDEDYWEKACDDMSATANSFDNDPFLTGLLIAIFEELEREYKTLRDAQKGSETASAAIQ